MSAPTRRVTAGSFGKMPTTWRRILKAMITGETDPSHLAELGSRRLGCSRDTLVEALDGRVRDDHRFLLDQHLKTIEQLEETMAAFDARIEAALAPFRDTVERLTQVPGLSTRAAEVVRGRDCRDRPRHEPVPDRRASSVLGRSGSRSRRERRQAPLDTGDQGSALAQACAGAMRLGSSEQEDQLLRSPIPAPQGTPRPQESGCRGRRLDPDHRLSPAPRRHLLPGPRYQASARTTSLAAIRPAPLASSQTASAASVTSSKSGAPHDPSRSSF